ncbi:uncharacterized protein LOC124164206 [Ischnura elegans]|uniref:uncharacterized protein LOC124164206 n=1 Tax=Ischnura elegans TaxID=197161 RepID=UPI001ED87DA9|nr:uncharacterized protein LOC124164206 [Ischnura elegans]
MEGGKEGSQTPSTSGAMSTPGHGRSKASKDPYEGVSWMKVGPGRRKGRAKVTGIVQKKKPANPAPAAATTPTTNAATSSIAGPSGANADPTPQSSRASSRASSREGSISEAGSFSTLSFDQSPTPTRQPHLSPSRSTAAPKSYAKDTSVFLGNLPANVTQKSLFQALMFAFPPLRTVADVSVFSADRKARLRIPASFGYLFEKADEKMKLDHRLGGPCTAVVRRPAAKPAATNKKLSASFSVVVKGVDRGTTEAELQEGLGLMSSDKAKVTRIIARRDGQPTTLMRVVTRDADLAQQLLQEGLQLYGKRHSVEPSHPPRCQPAQCRRCLGFDHPTQGCRRDLRCARCGASHRSAACAAENLKCANCGGGHHAGDSR